MGVSFQARGQAPHRPGPRLQAALLRWVLLTLQAEAETTQGAETSQIPWLPGTEPTSKSGPSWSFMASVLDERPRSWLRGSYIVGAQ